MRLLGLLFKSSYLAHRHEWSGAPLDRWLAVFLALAAGLMAIRWVPGGVIGIAICGALLLLLFAMQTWAAARSHVLFSPEASRGRHNPQAVPLEPMGKLPLRATGLFEVEGKEQFFTELQAYYRSFETREHVLMAIVPPSQLFLVANWPYHEVGMWYIFFKHDELRRIDSGALWFGSEERPGLRLVVERQTPPSVSPMDVWGGYRSGRSRVRFRRFTVYLSFDAEEARQRVLSDLSFDAVQLEVP